MDGAFLPGLPPAEPWPLTVRTGDHRVDVQAALAMLAPEWGLKQLIDISDEQARTDLARASVMALSFVAQSARGLGRPPVPQTEVDKADSIPERFLIRWRGEADPEHVKAIDAYWTSAAEHGMNASTFTARIIASSGADSRRRAVGRGRRALGTAARRRALPRAADARRGRADGRPGGLREAAARPRRPADGLRPPRLPGRGPARPRAAPHRPRDRLTAVRGGGGAREARRWPSCRPASPTACSPPTSSSGPRWCSTTPRSRRSSSPRCSPARASRAGRPTSWSRSARAG